MVKKYKNIKYMSAISQEEKLEKVGGLDAMGIETLMMTLLDKKGLLI